MEKNRRTFSKGTVLARPNNGLQPIQRDDVAITKSPNKSRGIRFGTPQRKLIIPPKRPIGGRQQAQVQQYPEQYVEQYPEDYGGEEEYIEDEEYRYQ